jgi:hypothetical protein
MSTGALLVPLPAVETWLVPALTIIVRIRHALNWNNKGVVLLSFLVDGADRAREVVPISCLGSPVVRACDLFSFIFTVGRVSLVNGSPLQRTRVNSLHKPSLREEAEDTAHYMRSS